MSVVDIKKSCDILLMYLETGKADGLIESYNFARALQEGGDIDVTRLACNYIGKIEDFNPARTVRELCEELKEYIEETKTSSN